MTPFERAARAHIASRGAPGTRELYTADLARWLVHCELDGVDPDNPTLEAATKFRDNLKRLKSDKLLSPQAVRQVLSALSSMYNAAGLVNVFNSKRLTRPEADDVALTKEFSTEEARALISAAEAEVSSVGIRDAAIFTILYEVGMRISSTLAMRRERILRRNGSLFVLVKSKKKGMVEAVLPEASMKALEKWLAIAPASEFVFPDRSKAKPVATRVISKRLNYYNLTAKVEHPHLHRFRASFATESFDAGIPLHEVQAAMHHANPGTTQRYDRGVRGTGVTTALAEFRKNKGK